MDNLTVFIVIIIILVLFFIFYSNNSKCNKRGTENLSSRDRNIYTKLERPAGIVNEQSYLDKLLEYTKKSNSSGNVLPYFVEMQFHNDYKDVITAFDIICESGRPVFNRSSEPVKFTPLEASQSGQMINVFMTQLNTTMKDKIKDAPSSMENGFNNIQENPSVESGWEKQMKKLGLPSNIYDKGTKKAVIRLIKVDKVDMFETDSQLKYDIYCIIQKDGSYDQMVIKVSFIMDKSDMNQDRNFFVDDKTVDLNVHVESVFVVGFMTNHSYGSQNKNVRQDFYTFENIEKNGMMNDVEVIKQLKKKYLDYQIESNGLTIQMSPASGNNLAIERLTNRIPARLD
jgi:hypothetical protein